MPRVPDIVNFLAHFLQIMLPQRHFTHAANRIDGRPNLLTDLRKKIVLALFRIHQRVDNFINFFVPFIPVPKPGIKNIQHTANISELRKQSPYFFCRHSPESSHNNAMIKKNKEQRNKGNSHKFRNSVKRHDDRHRHKSRNHR